MSWGFSSGSMTNEVRIALGGSRSRANAYGYREAPFFSERLLLTFS